MTVRNGVPQVLVIDDDITVRLIAERNLQKNGFEVVLAENGEQGLDLLSDITVDIILLDYEMPGMSGVEICRILKHQFIHGEIPILMITDKDDVESIEATYDAGATDFATKPLNWVILIHRIRYILRASETFRQMRLDQQHLLIAHKIAKIATWEWEPVQNRFFSSDEMYQFLSLENKKASLLNLEKFFQFIHPEDRSHLRRLIYNCLNESVGYDCEHRILDQNGNEYYVQHQGAAMHNEQGQVVNIVGTLRDITYSKVAERKIKDLAYYDPLTGLMNRQSFFTSINKLLSLSDKFQALSAVLFLDLDDFKRINDTLGHDKGDILLQQISERLKQSVRTADIPKSEDKDKRQIYHRELPNALCDEVLQLNSEDKEQLSLARLGGDEFTIFLFDIPNIEVAGKVCQRIIKALETPFFLEQHQIYTTFSIGISIAPDDATNIKDLLKNADVAMYHAKKSGKNNFQFFSESMNNHALQRLRLENYLRSALVNDEFLLNFQPKYRLSDQKMVGCEVLMRWQHEKLGVVSPVDFIPLAEETGLIIEISNWLIDEVLTLIGSWKQQGIIQAGFRFAINISGVQFNSENLVEKLCVFQQLYPGLFQHLEIELTESILMKSRNTAVQVLNGINKLGITLSLDDFGTGYSSLSYLNSFPFDHLKIDRSFIYNLEKNQQDEAIVKAIISMAKSLGMSVIAEGIETQWQFDFLNDLNCDFGQGYYMNKPLEKDAFLELLS